MDSKSFEILLTDLYDRYNPGKKSDIPEMLNKYLGQEFDAVYHILLKYNYPKNPMYDADFNNPQYVKTLISRYVAGERIILEKKKVTEQDKLNQKVEEANKQIKTIAEQTSEAVDKRIAELNTYMQQKKMEIDSLMENFKALSVPAENPNEEVKLNILFTDVALKLPSDISKMAVGTRILVMDMDNRPHGIEIKDIVCDYISFPGKCIKEITIDKL